jgi:hypothetical protein
MYEKDYIMRMIEQMIKVLLEIFGLRQKGSFEEVFEVIDMTLEKYTGLSSKMIDEFDSSSLIAYFSPGGNLNLERCFVVGVLLKEEGDALYELKKIHDAVRRYNKSLALLNLVKDTAYAEMLPDMNSIFKDLIKKLNTGSDEYSELNA